MTDKDNSRSGERTAEFFRRIGSQLSRRSFLSNSAKVGGGALALSASGTAAAKGDDDSDDKDGENGNAMGSDEEISDLDILNFALTLEKLEFTFYEEGLRTFSDSDIAESQAAQRAGDSDAAGTIRDRLTDVRNHEEAHVNVLTNVITALGGEPVSNLRFEFPYDSFDEFIALAATFEPLGVDAYAGGALFIDTTLLLPSALGIHSVEANHAAYLRELNGGNPVTQAFNTPAAMSSVVARASQFIVGLKDNRQRFAVTIENVSDSNTLQTSKGAQPVPLSPGAYAVHSNSNPLFTPGEQASSGLERLAEDGFPHELVDGQESSLLKELIDADNVVEPGVFLSLKGGLPPLSPGEEATFHVTAAEGEALSFATMFVPSNDLFFAPGKQGISLFGDGPPVSGDVTDQLTLWDAGTEVNQEPGVGEDIKPKQPLTAVDVGQDEGDVIRPIEAVEEEYEYPSVSDVISVTIEPQ
jgi:hypothetical protein